MICKTLEVRDRATFIPVLAIKPSPQSVESDYLWKRGGWSLHACHGVMLIRLHDGISAMDPYSWPGQVGIRTMPRAHLYICNRFDELHDGDVVDVEFIMGETPSPKVSERFTSSSL